MARHLSSSRQFTAEKATLKLLMKPSCNQPPLKKAACNLFQELTPDED